MRNGLDPFPRSEVEQTIVARFLATVKAHRSRPAIETEAFAWTYEQLANIVDQLAQQIVAHCGPEPGRVGLLFTHDAPMCAAMLAALRAGKTYVPLDPAYPAARLRLIYEDSQPQALFTEIQCARQAQCITEDASGLVVCDPRNLNPDAESSCSWPIVAPTSMAYILYTSGSTGKPKGVVQNHRNILHFIGEYTRNLGISAHDRLTLLSSYSFDASVMATYGALLNGALLLPRNIKVSGFSAMGAWVNERSITIYHSTPTVFRTFLAAQQTKVDFRSVRLVVLGGEPVTKNDIHSFNRWFAPGSTLVNGLGPTESTVTLQNFIAHGDEPAGALVSVGRPVRNTEVILLTDEGRPTDAEGELAFSSEHIAVGYWRRPDQDALSFVSHPDDASRRMYRTGDLARRDPRGMYYFLGRKDLQVKINGVRIEIEDIECVVESLDGVRQCVVVADGEDDGHLRLVAFLRMDQHGPAPASIAQRARTLLPDAMVPHRFLAIGDFPLTPSNKIDRKALEQEARRSARSATEPVEFHTADALEERVAARWCEVLGCLPSDRAADFFESGGDSLSALQFVDCLEELTGTRLDFGEIFVKRSFGEIVDMARSASGTRSGEGVAIPLARQLPGAKLLFSICGIQLYQELADALAPSVATCGIFLPVEEEMLKGKDVPEIHEIAKMYLAVLLKKQPVGPFHLIGVSFGGMLAYEMARQLVEAGHRVAYLGILDTTLPQTIGRLDRARAHLRLLKRRGPSELFARIRARFRRSATRRVVGAGESRSAERIAAARGDIYTEALTRYRRAMPTFGGDLFFYRATELSEFENACLPENCNWPRYVKGAFKACRVQGGHISMLERPNVSDLACRVLSDMQLQLLSPETRKQVGTDGRAVVEGALVKGVALAD